MQKEFEWVKADETCKKKIGYKEPVFKECCAKCDFCEEYIKGVFICRSEYAKQFIVSPMGMIPISPIGKCSLFLPKGTFAKGNPKNEL